MKLIKVVKKYKPIKKTTESQYMTSDRMNDEKKYIWSTQLIYKGLRLNPLTVTFKNLPG